MSGDAEIFTFQYGSTLIFAVYVFVSLSNFFTFQYGSTLILIPVEVDDNTTDFTFQYGSTLILLQAMQKEALLPLHSNMVLL